MMKRTLKNILAVSLAGTMALTTMGCSTDGQASSDAVKGATEAMNENGEKVITTFTGTYTPDDPYHLVWAYAEFYTVDDSERERIQNLINDYTVPNYCIEVELIPLNSSEANNKIQLMLSAGDELDIMPIYYTMAQSWIDMDGIYDLTDLMKTDDGQKIIDAIGETRAMAGQTCGITYGIPASKEDAELGGFLLRSDICDELGITEKYGLTKDNDVYDGHSHTWEEYEDILATVHEAYPNMDGLYMIQTDDLKHYLHEDYLIDQMGGLDTAADSNTTTVCNLFETESYLNYAKMINRWYHNGYINEDAAVETTAVAQAVQAGNVFSYVSDIKPGFCVEKRNSDTWGGYDFYCFFVGDGFICSTDTDFFNTGIATNSEDPEMAFKFLSAMYSDPEIMTYWLYGEENVDYAYNDDGTIYWPEGVDGSNYKYHLPQGWYMGNQFIAPIWNDGTLSADYWDSLDTFNSWCALSPAYGFLWDNRDYTSQITALTNVYEKYRAEINTGTTPADELESRIEEMNQELYAAGLQDIIDAKQAQLDEWLAQQEQ